MSDVVDETAAEDLQLAQSGVRVLMGGRLAERIRDQLAAQEPEPVWGDWEESCEPGSDFCLGFCPAHPDGTGRECHTLTDFLEEVERQELEGFDVED